MEIKDIKISQLQAADYNPRIITEEALDGLMNSIKEFGIIEPIIVNKHHLKDNKRYTVIGGHQRIAALKWMQEKTAPCLVVDFDEIKERSANLALNNPHIQGDFERALLADVAASLDGHLEFDSLNLSDLFEDFNIDLTPPVEFPGEEDDIPDVDEEDIVIQEGDLIQLGNHRLLCGDCTLEKNVSRMMDGKKANMVFTDPPYGVNYVGKTKNNLTIENDDTTEEFKNAIKMFPITPGCAVYVCCPGGNKFIEFETAFIERCYQSSTIIWVKDSMVLGHGDYHFKHEPILYGWEKNGSHKFYGDRTQTTVWEIPRPKKSEQHPTMKPVELVEKAVVNSSKRGLLVYDPFLGSGSTLIACEKTKRQCYGMEISPHYCQVTIQRWCDFTGNDTIMVNNNKVEWSTYGKA